MGLKSYRELEVWQRSMDLVVGAYKLTDLLPETEKFGLRSQLQRASVSIPANIAEGYGRVHRGDYVRHLSIARGSLAEVETLLAVSVRLEFVSRDAVKETWDLTQDVGRMLTRLIHSLRDS